MDIPKNTYETPSQIIKSILTVLEAFSLPVNAVDIIRKRHWDLHNAIKRDIENGKTTKK